MVRDKVVVITGATSGIGQATAKHLAGLGAKVVLGATREQNLKLTAGEIEKAGGQAAYGVVDVRNREECTQLLKKATDAFGKVDVLFNNAGVMPIGPIEELDVDSWEQMIDVNIKGVVFGIAAALPIFLKQGHGHFINTCSVSARKTVPGQAVYSATKAAILALSDGLRQELAGRVRVSVLTPGMTNTNFSAGIHSEALKREMQEKRAQFAMSPKALADAIAFMIDQPDELDIGEVIIRSSSQP